jgi:SAM-dependent methyltransferase
MALQSCEAAAKSPTGDAMSEMPARVDQARFDAFVGKMLGDIGAALGASLVLIGDKLGLYKALAEYGPLAARELAQRTGTAERYIREWLAAQAAAGYVTYDGISDRYHLEPEQAMVLADEDSPFFMAGGFQVAASTIIDEPKITEAFRTGRGVGWHEHNACLFCGTERFFRPAYRHNLVGEWLPALDGMVARLEAGAKVADVGCGHGVSTLLMAKAYPKSQFFGFDYHRESIEQARHAAEREELSGHVAFETAGSKDFPDQGYDLVCFFDCLHDMGDPVGAAVHARETLTPGGTLMIIEPFAHDTLAENLNPVGRIYYSASTMICTPASMAQEVGLALGAQAGMKRLREVLTEAGFSRIRKAAETPFNFVIEARV